MVNSSIVLTLISRPQFPVPSLLRLDYAHHVIPLFSDVDYAWQPNAQSLESSTNKTSHKGHKIHTCKVLLQESAEKGFHIFNFLITDIMAEN